MKLTDKEQKFYNQLTSLEKKFRKLKTVKGIDNRFELMQDANDHSFNSVLLAVHYGTPKDVETIKELIIKQARTPVINPSFTKRVNMTRKFYEIHKSKMPEPITFYVDIPNPDIDKDEMINVSSFESRKEAINFARIHFGADKNGCISLISQA